MSRYDKYEPKGGGFRAPLNVATADGKENTLYGVGLSNTGRVVIGAGATGIVGVYIATGLKAAGDIVDVMTDGEIVEFKLSDETSAGAGTAGAAGTAYYADPDDGTISTTASTNVYIGHTVEASRLIVRVRQILVGA